MVVRADDTTGGDQATLDISNDVRYAHITHYWKRAVPFGSVLFQWGSLPELFHAILYGTRTMRRCEQSVTVSFPRDRETPAGVASSIGATSGVSTRIDSEANL